MDNNQDIKKELQADEAEIKKLKLSVRALTVVVCLILAAGIGALAYWKSVAGKVTIDTSEISAPEIDLAPTTSDILQEMFVKKGDMVTANEPVARVGNEIIKAKTAGVIIAADAAIGQLYNPGQTVVKMIDPTELRVVGHIDENKGLSAIRVGDYATFTVDAFGSRVYQGVVDEISPSARQNDVVFSISDKRPTNVFDVKVRYDVSKYPELLDGMSARLYITTD